ncbi:hypothetical protein DV26_00125 [Amycolatopsis mediterranei]|nr:hypothetical protein DV26_00125 [Amycolatopsis mediterranei]
MTVKQAIRPTQPREQLVAAQPGGLSGITNDAEHLAREMFSIAADWVLVRAQQWIDEEDPELELEVAQE